MSAVLLIQQPLPTTVTPRLNRCRLPNTIGNLTDRTVTFPTFVLGGMMDAAPTSEAAWPTVSATPATAPDAWIAAGKSDWKPASTSDSLQPYLNRLYYDCLTPGFVQVREPALRYLIDTIGIDPVVLGAHWPADMMIDWPVGWVMGFSSLTLEE